VAVPAYKEWAVVVRALLSGEQLLDVRKGGIREDGRHFGLQATRVWLYPTAEHQRADLLKPAYRHWLDEPSTPHSTEGSVTIPGWADIVGVATITDADQLAKIESKFIWSLDYAESRLKWKRRDPLWILAMRAYRLTEPLTIPWRDEYGGCTSWVPVVDVPDDPAELPSEPALSDESFTTRLQLVTNDLAGGFAAPRPSSAQPSD
jgi:hypothetical protein